ncbi:hypothetical protein L1887_15254 [Cichorium endivia]|nr:hypothetical protein L1887_15254 [Cichorium endivia]
MASKFQFQPLHLQISLILLFLFSDSLSASQSNHQNIQVYFPILQPPPPRQSTSPPAQTTTAVAQSNSSNKPIAKAVAITASTTLVLSGLLFLLLLKFKRRSKKEPTNSYADNRIVYSNGNRSLQKNDEFVRFGAIKRVIVDDEQGLDVIYWKKLQDNGGRKSKFDRPVQKIHLLRGKSSGSRLWAVVDNNSDLVPVVNPLKDVTNQEMTDSQQSLQLPPPPPALPPSNATAPAAALPPPPPFGVMVERKVSAPPPTPPPPPPLPGVMVERKGSAPPPTPPPSGIMVERKGSAPPPTPPPPGITVERKGSAPPPPPPPKTGGLILSPRRPTPPPKSKMSLSNDNQVKLKPLHWDKVNANVTHDMVWHKLHNGSFRVDDDQMKTLFGTVAIDKKSPRQESAMGKEGQRKPGTSKIFLLDTRKSQNIAIVLKSIAVSRGKIIEGLQEGLPVVGGVSSEFFNVKKAAGIDFDAFSKSCLGLRNQLAEIKKSMEECGGDRRRGGFVREIARFVEDAEMEIETLREEEERVMAVVKATNEYYQVGGSKEFELFVIISGFLEMVDKACVDIAVKLQKRRTGGGLPEAGMQVSRFPALPANFKVISSSSSSSDSD